LKEWAKALWEPGMIYKIKIMPELCNWRVLRTNDKRQQTNKFESIKFQTGRTFSAGFATENQCCRRIFHRGLMEQIRQSFGTIRILISWFLLILCKPKNFDGIFFIVDPENDAIPLKNHISDFFIVKMY
jgi:hypothetical protein